MKALPIEMRKRILDDCANGLSEIAAAKKWNISPSTITKLKQHFRKTGSLEPKNGKRGPKPKLAPHRQLLQQIVDKTPDATLEEIREQLPVKVCNQTVAVALRQLRLAYKKKTLYASEQLRPDVAQQRAEWKVKQLGFNPKKLLFLDEMGAKTNLTRLYGRAPIGQRLVDRTPQGHWMTVTFVGVLSWQGMLAPYSFVGSMNGERFVDYVERHVLPILHKGDVVVMDNLTSHKGKVVEDLFASVGASVLYLPPYSPDLNPIELGFSKLKSVLRKKKIRDVNKLRRFLRQTKKLFTQEECQHYYKHNGYTRK